MEIFERIVVARWETARMLAARCGGVSLDVYRVRGWDGWQRHVALALLASAFRTCLPAGTVAVPGFAPVADEPVVDEPLADSSIEELLAYAEPVALQPADDVASNQSIFADALAALYAEADTVEELDDADDLLAARQEELSARTSAREAGLMPAFEGPADVIGIPSGDETRRSRVVLSELGRHTVGLVVDGVSEVVMVATSDIEPPPSLIAGANDGQVCGVARLGDRLVLFLDPDRMLPNR